VLTIRIIHPAQSTIAHLSHTWGFERPPWKSLRLWLTKRPSLPQIPDASARESADGRTLSAWSRKDAASHRHRAEGAREGCEHQIQVGRASIFDGALPSKRYCTPPTATERPPACVFPAWE
jgi:hypothetical protein